MMTLLVMPYPQFQPSSAADERAVVDAKRNTPVRTAPVVGIPAGEC